ncbi:LEA type 2 family protein [Polaribacter batillariae]|uniref:LEA type 2 family protein n=1 Tax=Polaribacter batillariae TaxID=2808900 RepID=A0ABX7SW52_9FLAO|nr:LEA type 2 family protein [Polaribacter batillariae]QTD37731.1 LEA type 2 family protein [Polaribacter batillariae]
MKKLLYFTSLIFLFVGCSVQKEPVFIKVDHVKIFSFTRDTIKLKADAFFENPNDVSGKITTKDIKVFVNEVEVAEIFSEEFKVPARNEFSIPLIAHIPTKNLLNTHKKGTLGGLLNSLISNKINVKIKGKLKYVVFGFTKEFLVDKTQEIKIKL